MAIRNNEAIVEVLCIIGGLTRDESSKKLPFQTQLALKIGKRVVLSMTLAALNRRLQTAVIAG